MKQKGKCAGCGCCVLVLLEAGERRQQCKEQASGQGMMDVRSTLEEVLSVVAVVCVVGEASVVVSS